MRHAILPLLLVLGLAVPASAPDTPHSTPTPDAVLRRAHHALSLSKGGHRTPDSPISIVPRPTSVTAIEGACTLTSPVSVLVDNDGRGELRETMGFVREFLRE